MTQGEIIELLEKSEKPLTNKQISKILGVSNSGTCLRKLVNHNDVKTTAIIVEIETGYGIIKKPIIHYFV